MTWHGSIKTIVVLLAMAMMLTGRSALAGEARETKATLLLAQNGDTEAQYALGDIYSAGNGPGQDSRRAAFWYLRAAMGGHAEAQHQIGLRYDSGDGVAQNYTQALVWYGKAAAQGHPESQSHREKILDHLDSLRRAADLGEANAQCTLGDLYAKGNGVLQDEQQAAAWYRLAAEQGAAPGQFKLGFLHAEGRGVSLDPELAVAWYRKAAEQGHADAEYHLSTMYFRGLGVARDPVTAFAWLSLAAGQDHPIATANRAFATSRLTPEQLRRAQTLARQLQTTITPHR